MDCLDLLLSITENQIVILEQFLWFKHGQILSIPLIVFGFLILRYGR